MKLSHALLPLSLIACSSPAEDLRASGKMPTVVFTAAEQYRLAFEDNCSLDLAELVRTRETRQDQAMDEACQAAKAKKATLPVGVRDDHLEDQLHGCKSYQDATTFLRTDPFSYGPEGRALEEDRALYASEQARLGQELTASKQQLERTLAESGCTLEQDHLCRENRHGALVVEPARYACN
jgi:hypothetical protein